jgi:hypothetical protein
MKSGEAPEMKGNDTALVEGTYSIATTEDMTVDDTQLAEQLYTNAGLAPIVDLGIRDYDRKIQQEDKLINKVFGTRGSDIRGYSESVARRTALAVHSLLNKQYGGRVGDMRAYIMSLEDDRDRANVRYDELMGRVVGILGNEYKELRTDSTEFIEKLTKTLGDGLKDAKFDQKALTESLADIDGLRKQIVSLNKEKGQLGERHEAQIAGLKSDHKEAIRRLQSQIDNFEWEKSEEQGKYEAQITELKSDHKEEIRNLQSQMETLNRERIQETDRYEAQITELKSDHKEEVRNLQSQIDTFGREKDQEQARHEAQTARLDSYIRELESERDALVSDLAQSRRDHSDLRTAMLKLAEGIPGEGIGKKHSDDLYEFVLTDSNVPSTVITGIGQFVDFKKYLRLAVENGAKDVQTRIEGILESTPQIHAS